MMTSGQEVGKYILPILPSIEGIGPEIDRKLGKAFGGVSKQASLAISGGVRDGVKEAEAAVKKSSDAVAKLRDKEAAAADKLATAEARIEEVREKGGSALKRAEGQRNAAYRAQQAALRDIEQQTRSLQRAQQSLTEAQEEAARGGARAGAGFLTGLRGSVSGAAEAGSGAASSFAEGFAGSSALLRLGSAGGPVGAALAAAGLIGGGLLVQNVMAGIEREPARDLIQARLRIDDASMAALGKSAATAYVHNFGESVPENLNVGQLAIQGGLVIDANDPALTGVIEKIQGINQLIGGDLTKTVQSVSILMRSGMASSAEEAFNLIARGYEITGDLGGDFLDSIGEYSSGWKNAGLTAQQALALIKQAQDNGVDVTDRSADALREFGRRINEEGDTMVAVMDNIGLNGEAMYDKFKQGGPAAFEAFDQVFDKIRAIEDPARRGQAILAILGDTAGDFSEAFEQWDPSEAVAKFGDVNGAADEVQRTMGDNVVNSFEEAKRSIEQSMDDVQDKLAAVFGDDLKEAAQWVEEHTDDIAGFFTTVGEFAIEAVAQIVKFAADSSRALAQFVNVVGDVQGGILTAGATILDLVGQDDAAEQWRRDAESMYGLADGLYDFADAADRNYQRLENVKDKFGNIGDEADDAKTSTSNLGNAIDGLPRDKTVKLNVVDGNGNPVPLNVPLGSNGVPLPVPGVPAASAPPGYQVVPGSGTPSGTPSFTPAIPPLPGIRGAGGMGPGGRPVPGSGFMPYGLKAGTDTGGYGSSGPAFPEWVHQIEQQFGVKASTYKNHQESDPSDPRDPHHGENYAANPQHLNRGIDWSGSVENMQRLAEWLQSIAPGTPQLEQIIWQNPKTMQRIGLGGAGNLTTGYYPATGEGSYQEHQNHVHTRQSMAIPLSGGGSTTSALGFTSFPWDDVAQAESSGNWQNADTGKNGHYGGLQFSPDTWKLFGGLEFAPSPEQASREQQIEVANRAAFTGYNGVAPQGLGAWQAITDGKVPGVSVNSTPTLALSQSGPGSPNLVSAFGNQYKAGIGTPGYNEYGEPGYYETDPHQIAQAQRRAEDTQRQIEEADQRIADAKKKRADLEDEINVTAEDRAQADKDIADAEREAKRAREDAEWAKQDAVEAQQGKFKAAQKAKGGKNGDGGDLSGIGGIFGSFLKETFGIDGSLFPDLADLMPIKMGGALLSAFKGPILGAAQGQLGIQQPGWQPGMPTQIPDAGSGSGLPFGMVPSPFDFAGNAQPGMAPPGSPASGIGSGPAPGPVDNSRNLAVTVNGGPNEDQIANTVRREVSNVQRVATYTAPGA